MKKLRWVLIALVMLGVSPLFAQTNYYSIATGNWHSTAIWSNTSGGSSCTCTPTNNSTDVINIEGGFTVTIATTPNGGSAVTLGTLNIANSSSLSIRNGITVNAATNIGGGSSGTLTIDGTTGAKTFIGLVTVYTGASWSESVNAAVLFNGGIANNGGTFNTGTSAHTFGTNQTLSGALNIQRVAISTGINLINNGTINYTDRITLSGATSYLTNNGTVSPTVGTSQIFFSATSAKIYNNGTLTISGTLNGFGAASTFPEIVQGANSVLNINGATPVGPTTTVTVSSAGTPNTVNYGGSAQTILNNTSGGSYHHLNLSGSGAKSFQAPAYTINIAGDLTISGSVTTSGIGSTLNFNGTNQNISGGGALVIDNVQLSGSGTKTIGLSATIGSGFLIGTGSIAGLSNSYTYTSNSISILGGSQAAGTYGSFSSNPQAGNRTDAFFSGTGLITVATGTRTYYSIASGNWTTSATWSTLGFGFTENFGTFPVTGEAVNLGDNISITVNGSQACGSLLFSAANTGSTTLDITGGSLAAGAISLPRPTSGSASNIVAVGTGTLSASALTFSGTTGGAQQLTISTGSVMVSGNVSSASTSGTIQFTGTGSMTVGGTMFTAAQGTLITIAGCTFGYNGSSAQTVPAHTYRNLSLSGAGPKTSPGGTTNVGINAGDPGNLTIADGTSLTVGPTGTPNFFVYGTTTIGNGTSGSLNFTTTSGNKTFGGLVTVRPGATWDNSINENVGFLGGITNQGIFTAGTGTYNFNTNSQALTGVLSIPVLTVSTGAFIVLTVNGTLTTNSITITGGNNSIANSGTVTINTGLSGGGFWTQNASSTLNLPGTASLTNGIVASSTGNTVNYTGGAQTVLGGNYYNLSLSGSGTKTLQSTTTSVGGSFTMSGTTSVTLVSPGISIGGDVTLGASTSLTLSSYSLSAAGNWASNGTLIGAGGTVNFNGANQSISSSATTSFYDVNMSGSGTKTLTTAIATTGTMSIATGVILDLGIITTHTATTFNMGGISQPVGTHGSSSSVPTADYTNDTFFAPTTGYLSVGALTFYSRANGDWNNANTWSNATFGGAVASSTPGPSDVVRIGGNFTVTLTGDASCVTLAFFQGLTELNTLNINNGVTLTVSGNVVIPRSTNNVFSNVNTLNVGPGALTAGNIVFTNGTISNTGANVRHRIDVSTGTVTVNGNINATGISALINYTGAGLLKLYGTIFGTSGTTGGTLTMAASSIFEYAGDNQTVRDANFGGGLAVSGTGIKAWALLANRTIGGSLTVYSGTALTLSNSRTLDVAGSTNITGSIALGAIAAKTFTGDVTLNSGAVWDASSNAPYTFGGNFTNNATTFTPGTGQYTFTGASKTISGSPISIVALQVDGTYTNSAAITVSSVLQGAGTLTNGATGILNLGGTSTLANLDASTADNTVNYFGTMAQTVIVPVNSQYQNLSFNNSTASGIATTATPTTLLVGGNWTNNGAVAVGAFQGFNPNGGTVEFNGTGAQNIQGTAPSSFFNLTSNNTGVAGSLTLLSNTAVSTTLYIQDGDFANSASLTMGNGSAINRSGASISVTGSAPITGVGPSGNYYNLIYSGAGTINTGIEALGMHIKDVTIGTGSVLSVTQSNAMNLYGIMLVNTNATYDPGTSLLTVRSWSDLGTGTGGSIGTITGIVTPNRPVTVERYFREKDDKDRFISSPVTNATVAQLQTVFPVTGDFVGTSYPCTGCVNNGNTLKWYRESTTGILNKGYRGYPGTNNLATLAVGVGYDAYMWNGVVPATIPFNGPINQGNINALGTNPLTGQVVSKTVVGAGTPTADGWNLIGNPYPAPIRWTGTSSGGWTLTNIDDEAWAWDVYDEAWELIDNGKDIAVGQAFWVLVTTPGNGSGAINITEAAKSTSRSGNYYRERNPKARLKLNLTNGSSIESAYIEAKEGSTQQYSLDHDFPKIELGIERMHMTLVKDNHHLGVYGFNSTLTDLDIPVRIVSEQEGVMELSFESEGNAPDLTGYYLVDMVTNERIAFNTDLRYSFNYSKKHPENRFLLTKKTDGGSFGSVAVSAFPNPTTGKFHLAVNGSEPVLAVELIGIRGEVIKSYTSSVAETSNLELNLEDKPNGVYLLKVRLASGVIVKRIVKH